MESPVPAYVLAHRPEGERQRASEQVYALFSCGKARRYAGRRGALSTPTNGILFMVRPVPFRVLGIALCEITRRRNTCRGWPTKPRGKFDKGSLIRFRDGRVALSARVTTRWRSFREMRGRERSYFRTQSSWELLNLAIIEMSDRIGP